MKIPPPTGAMPHRTDTAPTKQDAQLRAAAKALEANFLTEMLKSAGLGKLPESFGGGAGEDQFSSMLIREQAQAITDAGGIGLAESLFEALKKRADHVG